MKNVAIFFLVSGSTLSIPAICYGQGAVTAKGTAYRDAKLIAEYNQSVYIQHSAGTCLVNKADLSAEDAEALGICISSNDQSLSATAHATSDRSQRTRQPDEASLQPPQSYDAWRNNPTIGLSGKTEYRYPKSRRQLSEEAQWRREQALQRADQSPSTTAHATSDRSQRTRQPDEASLQPPQSYDAWRNNPTIGLSGKTEYRYPKSRRQLSEEAQWRREQALQRAIDAGPEETQRFLAREDQEKAAIQRRNLDLQQMELRDEINSIRARQSDMEWQQNQLQVDTQRLQQQQNANHSFDQMR